MSRLVLKNPATTALWLACGAFFFACLARMVLSPFFIGLAYRRDALQGWDDANLLVDALASGDLSTWHTGAAPNYLPDFAVYLPFHFIFGDDAHAATLATGFVIGVIGALGWFWFARMFAGNNWLGRNIAPAAALLIYGGILLFSAVEEQPVTDPALFIFNDYPSRALPASLLLLPYHHGGAFAVAPFLFCWFWRCAISRKTSQRALFAGGALAAASIFSDWALLAWFAAPAALALLLTARRRRRIIRPMLILSACVLAAAVIFYAASKFIQPKHIDTAIYWPYYWLEMAQYLFVDSTRGGPTLRSGFVEFPLYALLDHMDAWMRQSTFSLMLWGAGLILLAVRTIHPPANRQRWAATACLLAVFFSGFTGATFPHAFNTHYFLPFFFVPLFSLPPIILTFQFWQRIDANFLKNAAQKIYLTHWAAAVVLASFIAAPKDEHIKQAAAARHPPAIACFDKHARRYGLQNGLSHWGDTSVQFSSKIKGVQLRAIYAQNLLPYRRDRDSLLRGENVFNFILSAPTPFAADNFVGREPMAVFACDQLGEVRVYPPFSYILRFCELFAKEDVRPDGVNIEPMPNSPLHICRAHGGAK